MVDDRARAGLRGPVKSCRTESVAYKDSDDNLREWHRSWTSEQFLPDGRLEERRQGSPDGSEAHTDCRYDDAGRLREQVHWQAMSPVGSTVYDYDPRGRLVRVTRKTPQGTETVITTCSYDAQGRRSMTRHVGDWSFHTAGRSMTVFDLGDESGGFIAEGADTATTTYDELGRAQDTIGHDREHCPIVKASRLYDGQGRLVEVSKVALRKCYPEEEVEAMADAPAAEREVIKKALAEMYGPGAVISRTTFQYDVDGRLVEQAGTLGSVRLSRETKTYNERGDLLEVVYRNDAPEGDVTLEGGWASREPGQPVQPLTHRFEYTHDDRGNWTEKRNFSSGGTLSSEFLSSLTKRQLTYW